MLMQFYNISYVQTDMQRYLSCPTSCSVTLGLFSWFPSVCLLAVSSVMLLLSSLKSLDFTAVLFLRTDLIPDKTKTVRTFFSKKYFHIIISLITSDNIRTLQGSYKAVLLHAIHVYSKSLLVWDWNPWVKKTCL